MALQKDDVLAALRADDVIRHLSIKGQWRGHWLRSRRCAEGDHSDECFGIRRDGKWHCWSCNKGGDLLALIALSEGLNLSDDFPKVLAAAAAIAGVEDKDSFGATVKPAPVARPELPPLAPLKDRIAIAKRRAAWVWGSLYDDAGMTSGAYLRSRGIDADAALTREPLRVTPLRVSRELADTRPDLRALAALFRDFGVVIPVRAVDDGQMVDLRVRRYEPREGQPKIVGMSGGVTTGPAEQGRPRQLVGCYGHPENVDADLVVVCEGAFDYLTALVAFPNAQVLAATEAGSMGLVAGHAARQLARRDEASRLLIVEQADPPRVQKDGTTRIGAADDSINESVNAATKVAITALGARRVGWLFCGGQGTKDLNDLWRAGQDEGSLFSKAVWWSESSPPPGVW